MIIEQQLLTNANARPALRKDGGDKYFIRAMRAIVIHWTANEGPNAGADAHRRYFNTETTMNVSAHYFVENDRVVQIIPDNEVAFHCGDRPRPSALMTARRIIHRVKADEVLTPNYYTIGIEMCVNPEARFIDTVATTAKLTALKLKEHNLPLSAVVRHYDVSGKECPAFFVRTPVSAAKPNNYSWQTFLALVRQFMD